MGTTAKTVPTACAKLNEWYFQEASSSSTSPVVARKPMQKRLSRRRRPTSTNPFDTDEEDSNHFSRFAHGSGTNPFDSATALPVEPLSGHTTAEGFLQNRFT